jgi:hypothetical protein
MIHFLSQKFSLQDADLLNSKQLFGTDLANIKMSYGYGDDYATNGHGDNGDVDGYGGGGSSGGCFLCGEEG